MTYMSLNYVDAPITIGGNISRYHLYLMLLQQIADGGQEAWLLRRAHTYLGCLPAYIQDHIRRSPRLKVYRIKITTTRPQGS